jgi:chaperonin GroES
MPIIPLYDRVLLRRIEKQEIRRCGIIIPQTAQAKSQEAEVIEVGSGRVNDKDILVPFIVKKGDIVLVGKYSGTEIEIENSDYIIVREEEILAIKK